MDKIGNIPPHFLYFLNKEGIDIYDFKSSDFTSPNNYDRMIVRFPYGQNSIHIQVIFEPGDPSKPPDFMLLENCLSYMDYSEITKQWNFKDSQTLYNALSKIKQLYADIQEQKLNEVIKINSNNQHNKYFETVGNIINLIKHNFLTYRLLPKNNHFCDIHLKEQSPSKLEQIEISYPLDCFIRSRAINRAPIITLIIPVDYGMKYHVKLNLPHFVSNESISFKSEEYSLLNYQFELNKAQMKIINDFKRMEMREKLIRKIIECNIGFVLEVDTLSFLKLSIYCHLTKTVHNQVEHSQKIKINNPVLLTFNFLLFFIFANDDSGKFEFQVVDMDHLRIQSKKKLDVGATTREINNILHIVLGQVEDAIQLRKNRVK